MRTVCAYTQHCKASIWASLWHFSHNWDTQGQFTCTEEILKMGLRHYSLCHFLALLSCKYHTICPSLIEENFLMYLLWTSVIWLLSICSLLSNKASDFCLLHSSVVELIPQATMIGLRTDTHPKSVQSKWILGIFVEVTRRVFYSFPLSETLNLVILQPSWL